MDFNEFNQRALSALNHYPKKDRLVLLRRVVAYTNRYGYKAAANQILPALEKGGQKCQGDGGSTPASGHTATLF